MYFYNTCYIVTHIATRLQQAFQAVRERLTPFGVDFGVFHFADLLNA